MKTCFLVYRINSQSLTESRELVKILSTAKAELIAVPVEKEEK
jgi:hypothetical protein